MSFNILPYELLLKKLYTVNKNLPMRLGLETVLFLDQLLENSSSKFETIHIAGTNGKGSVALKIAKGLQLSQPKVGLFTSPHIASFRERIRINDTFISHEEIEKHLSKIFYLAEKHCLKPTFFEYVTLLAFSWFAEQRVSYAVVEVGLGGRLDATNIITPKLSIITSISLDHTHILGDSLEQIAYEKSGIIKEKVPVVFGPQVPLNILIPIAHKKKAPFYAVNGTFLSFDEENNATAKKSMELLQLSPNHIEVALKASMPCRFETIAPQKDLWPHALICDVAHNKAGLHCLIRQITSTYPQKKIWLVFALSAGKDLSSCSHELKKAAKIWCVQASKERGLTPEELKKNLLLNGMGEENLFTAQSTAEALHDIWSHPGLSEAVLCICGSFFHMAEAKNALNIKQDGDTFLLNEIKI